ncbi:MAG: ABC transporter substrate-binding protein [Burkholderiales bacterium]|nr:ABC transporter substrate-binding protein [Burkholderiales bacterium]
MLATLIRNLFLGAGAALALGSLPVRAADPGVTDTEIVIGLHAPLSGPLAAFGVDALNAAKMWYEEVNKKGGINGRKIRLIVEDDKCNPNETVLLDKRLVTVDKVFLINGGSCTPAVFAAQEFITREKVPFVMLNAAGDSGVFPATRYMFGALGGTQRSNGAGMVEFAFNTLKARRMAFIIHDDDFGNANWATAKAITDRLGVQVVAAERISPRVTDVTAPMLNIRAAKPDVIISAAYPQPAVLIAQKYGEFKMTAIPLVQAVQGIPVPAVFQKNVANDAIFTNFYYTAPLNDMADGPKQQKWLKMYKQYYPDRNPGAMMAFGLPSAMAVTRALEKVGRNLTREAFVEAMESLDFDTGAVAGNIQFAKGRRDGMRSTIVVKFDGKKHTVMPAVYTWNGRDGM